MPRARVDGRARGLGSKGLSSDEAQSVYAALVTEQIPTTSVASKYKFVLTVLKSVGSLQGLCVQTKDEIKLKLGFIPVAELRAT